MGRLRPLQLACASARQLEKPNVDRAGAEADFAVGEIIFPHAAEALVEAERFDLRPGTPFIIRNHSYRETEWASFPGIVDKLMAGYDYPAATA